ncbi:DNA helicase IV [Weissella uvarum]|uniref:RNA polymerase recycling motor HelD n=1 Tax=Weissella uvarum TaxID=1479233 RepID=UPI00195F9805|nr:RNA polymerase recycling motor HelD [Weissella uvarum]MBM7617662.1 DNA helicase IV [Weissella uvarum]MCM0596011.1 AAA family ATPase [Weissella uvarum]
METREWKMEQQRLERVSDEIEQQLTKAEQNFDQAHAETYAVETNYGANTSINTIEEDDAMETNAEIQQQRNIVARVTETEQIMQNMVTTLHNLKASPYFGRVDIVEDGEAESLYIGLASLQDENGEFLINDWRAPISGVYYNGALGEVTYPTPLGDQVAKLTKKRQFKITGRTIENMFDTDVTIGDEMLQTVLGEQNDQKMHNIVATIQQEQNQIIRDTESDLMVVQGVAGSGKTSAILQRIAFLLFHARENLNSDQIVLFSPNRLFSSYISDVLPSLGERNMRQVTMSEFLTARLQGLTVQTLFNQYEQDQGPSQAIRQRLQQALESADLVTALQEYLIQLTSDQIVFTDIYFQGEKWFKANDFKNYYDRLPTAYPVVERIGMTRKHFLEKLQAQIETEQQADWVLDALNQLNDHEYQRLLDEDVDVLNEADVDMDETIKHVATAYLNEVFQPIDDALYNTQFVDVYQQFADFLTYLGHLQYAEIDEKWWITKAQRFLYQLEQHQIDYEDAVPVLLLRDLMTGSGTNQFMQYVFVDEMQDYAMLQMLYLKHAFPNAKFTLLGDAEQALFRPIQTPEALMDEYAAAFQVKKQRLIKLTKSYRSTQPIMNFAKALLPDGAQIEAFQRDGNQPRLITTTLENEAHILAEVIQQLQETQKTIAILTKTQAQAETVSAYLEAQAIQHQLLDADDRTRTENILVMPIYLAKGLEFDAVIGYDVSETNYPGEASRGLLYTLASRAMHELVLISVGDVTPLIWQVADTLQIET